MSHIRIEMVPRGPFDLEMEASHFVWTVVLLNVWVRSQPPEVRGPRQVRSRRK